MSMRMKVFLSTMWDMYFLWKFEWNKKMNSGEFEDEIRRDLYFMFNEGEKMPDLWEPIKELYMNLLPIEDYNQCEKKTSFVEKYSKKYNG